MNLYEQCQAAGIETDHHESDLYIPVTEATMALIKAYEFKTNVTTFISQIDKKLWYDVPFGYMPFWEKTARRAK
jgi:hypothetical protein